MNVRIALANSVLSQVIGSTCVDKGLLLDDDGFCSLLTNLINSKEEVKNLDLSVISDELTQYVNANF